MSSHGRAFILTPSSHADTTEFKSGDIYAVFKYATSSGILKSSRWGKIIFLDRFF